MTAKVKIKSAIVLFIFLLLLLFCGCVAKEQIYKQDIYSLYVNDKPLMTDEQKKELEEFGSVGIQLDDDRILIIQKKENQ